MYPRQGAVSTRTAATAPAGPQYRKGSKGQLSIKLANQADARGAQRGAHRHFLCRVDTRASGRFDIGTRDQQHEYNRDQQNQEAGSQIGRDKGIEQAEQMNAP